MKAVPLVVAGVFILLPSAVRATPPGSALAQAALQRCAAADAAGPSQQQLLAQGVELGEQAVTEDDHDAAAHFALFCNLGKQVRRAGIGPFTFYDFQRARRELDRALELDPTDPDLLAAKGALLLSLPPFFGGDVGESRRLLSRALVADPRNATTRAYLARAME